MHQAIQALCNRFVGAEVTDQKLNSCVIKELVEPSYKEFHNSLRRIFLLILSMANETEEATKSRIITKDSLRGIHLINANLDRFEDFCLRVLNKHGYEDPKKKAIMHSLIFVLELVGDEYKRLSIHILENNKVDEPIKEFIKLLNVQFRNYYDLHYSFTKEKTVEIYRLDEELTKMQEKYFPKLSNLGKEMLHHLKKLARYIISLTELRIDMEF